MSCALIHFCLSCCVPDDNRQILVSCKMICSNKFNVYAGKCRCDSWNFHFGLGNNDISIIWKDFGLSPHRQPPSYKAPPRQFQPPNCKLTPSKIPIGEGRFLCISIQRTCRLDSVNPSLVGINLHFGGCRFAFWRLKLSWGCCFIEKGGTPKKGGTLAVCERWRTAICGFLRKSFKFGFLQKPAVSWNPPNPDDVFSTNDL